MMRRLWLSIFVLVGLSAPMGIAAAMAEEESSDVRAYKEACESGDPIACFELGYLYENGMGMRQDKSAALKYYTKACDLKYQFACEATVRVQKESTAIRLAPR